MAGRTHPWVAVVLQGILVSAAAAVAFLPAAPSRVEHLYSRGIYAALQPAVTSLSNRAPVPLLDVLIVAVAALWGTLFAIDLVAGRGILRTIARGARRTIVWSAFVYLVFMAQWGLNYRRQPLEQKLEFNDSAITAESARAMAEAAVDQTNLLYGSVRSETHGDHRGIPPELSAAFSRALDSIGERATTVVARPKRSLFDWYFRRSAVSGMTDPIFLETLIASDVLPFERPFVIAHEWSHLAGLANEGEANFVGWLACVRGSAADRYSAWLFLYQELLPSLDRGDQASVAARLGPGPLADLRASRERLQRNVSPKLAAAGWRVYDSYLKANRIPAGAASYADVVRLVLGVSFRENWTPVRSRN
jgi:uncharacterized protein DUF3810